MKCKWLLIIVFLLIFGCGKQETEQEEPIIGKSSKLPPKTESFETILEEAHQPEPEAEITTRTKRMEPFPFTRGIYISAWMAATKQFSTILDSAAAAGLNTVVFDLKNENGDVFFAFPETIEISNKHINAFIDIEKMVSELHRRNFRAVTRLVLFHDQHIAEHVPHWRPQTSDGTPWRERKRGKVSWLDSSHPDVQARKLRMIELVAQSGVDEIQLDYIRFPTQGNLDEAVFYFEKIENEKAELDSTYVMRTKVDIIEEFVSQAQAICSRYDVSLTADIFAIVAWQRGVDIRNTGQDIPKISKHFQALHPMIYSSHFAINFNHREDVWNEPYNIVYRATKLTRRYADESCKIIPYIQANSWKVNYSPDYIYAQIQAIKDANGDGYILWNSSNKYMNTLRWLREFKEQN